MTDTIQNITDVLKQAFHNLGLDVQLDVRESLIDVIYRSMTLEGRYYHTPEHALALSDGTNPVQSLAALFHDVVYYQVDHGFSNEVWKIIQRYLSPHVQDEESFKLVEDVPADDTGYHLAKEIFAFSGGQRLYPNGGSNEFLSALVMAKKLEAIVPRKILLQVIAYIEATIPFRTRDENGIGPFERLADRLREASHDYVVPLSDEDNKNIITGAVIFANKDVENFADVDSDAFLDSTWKLLPENYPVLRKNAAYTLRDYRQALQGMREFLLSIRAEDVFHEYAGTPTQAEIHKKLLIVRRNLRFGGDYLEIKLLTLAILEALADVSGGQVLVSLFLGDANSSGHAKRKLTNFIPAIESVPAAADIDAFIYRLLKTGMIGPVDDTDVKTSPLALFIYHNSGERRVHSYLKSAYKMFEGTLKPAEFLQVLEPSLLAPIAEACAKIANSRTDELMAYVREIVQ